VVPVPYVSINPSKKREVQVILNMTPLSTAAIFLLLQGELFSNRCIEKQT
jgi:hypothetical protein